jgi:hypothetical protein
MADYDNTNRGSVWKNEKKETEKHPDFTGSVNVEGKEYWVSGWKRRPDQSDKAPALSFSLRAKDESAPTKQAETSGGGANNADFDDDIPFANTYARRNAYVV